MGNVRRLQQARELAAEINRYRFCAPDADPVKQYGVTVGFRELATKFLWAAGRLNDPELDASIAEIDSSIQENLEEAFRLKTELIGVVSRVEELDDDYSEHNMSEEDQVSESRICPYCASVGYMRVVGSGKDVKDVLVGGRNPFTVEAGTVYRLLACVNCEKVTLESSSWHEQMDHSSECDWETVHPSKRQPILGLPEAIEKEFNEAEAVRTASPNAYALLTRRVLEAVCEDRQADGKTLHAGLVDLAQRGEIPEKLAEVAQSLRQLGNVGAHYKAGSLTVEDLPSLEALCRAVLEYVYAAPRLVTQAESLIEEVRKRSTS